MVSDTLQEPTLKNFLRNNGLTFVLLGVFLVTWVGQFFAGANDYNEERRDHGKDQISYVAYATTGHFWQATGENWESEFLQMGLFTILTTFLFQKGSPESNDPDEPDDEVIKRSSTKSAPWPVRKGGLALTLYSHSQSLCFLLFFVVSMAIHAFGGLCSMNDGNRMHGKEAVTLLSYIVGSKFWFESFQNWQSEFLSLAAMVFLSVYLREAGSAESKKVGSSYEEHE